MTTMNSSVSTSKINSLQNLCLDKIILEFSRYYKAYSTAEDLSLKLKFEFLKKKFSFHILQNLDERHQLKTEYLDFLINQYLKTLDTRWLKEWSWETVSKKLSEIGPNVEDVIFSDRPWDKILCYLPNLKRACFLDHCNNEFLVYLSKFCSCIEILEIRNYMNVSDEGVEYVLKNMHNLQKIDYQKLPEILYSMHKSNINVFEKVKPYNITHLDLLYLHLKDTFSDILTVCVSVCPHLKSLTCFIFQKLHLDLCSQLQELEELELHCVNEYSLELNEVLTLNGKMLTSLNIYNFCISLSVLAQNCPRLNLLQMHHANLQHNVSDSVSVFHYLEKISFESFVLFEPLISQAVKCLLSSVPNLTQLCFTSCKLVPSDIKTQILRCCEQCKLSIIDFSLTDVDFAFLRDILVTCSTLETLILNDCDITRDNEVMDELKMIAVSLPNKPAVIFEEESLIVLSSSDEHSDHDDFMMDEYDGYFDPDEDYEASVDDEGNDSHHY